MRRLVVCCDGTWNTSDQKQDGVPTPTNVRRLHNCVALRDAEGIEQIPYYHPGIGTEGRWLARKLGGATGAGLDRNILSAYKWLATTYHPEDRIFLFGFSRGAYTVRCLADLICSCGLPILDNLPDERKWKIAEEVFLRKYRHRKAEAQTAILDGFHSPNIYFLGVWDTVGALGIPNEFAILNFLNILKRRRFHNTALSERVEHARHAVALDERRGSYSPTLWTNIDHRPTVKQVWFPGAHCDVGGGYLEKGLSDGALKWMLDEAADLGLALLPDMREQIHPNFQDVLHESCTGVFRHLEIQPRSIPSIDCASPSSMVHPSIYKRQIHPPIAQASYHSFRMLKPDETTEPIPIYAAQRWNETCLYLEAGSSYELSATGQWLDRKVKCGPVGTGDGTVQFGKLAHVAGSLWGYVERAYHKATHNRDADFVFTKREESMPWFCLVGVIANAGNPEENGTPARHQTFFVGNKCTITPLKSGFLYCFANDAWISYDNNKGSVSLTVHKCP